MEGKYESMAIEVLRPYTRDAPYPLDATTLFSSYASAMRYAKTDPSAYPGQVVSVDDSVLSKTAIYQIGYDKNGDGLVLQDITVGAGSQAFSFVGSVDAKSSLPASYVLNGDMYYVKDENAFYVAIKDKGSTSPSWQRIEMEVSIPYATKSNDGIITKEQYSTFFNSKESDAVYFNSPRESSGSGPSPESNRWIRVSHSETTGDYALASVGKVKDILKTVVSQAVPHIVVEIVGGQTEYEAGTVAKPELRITYYQELGGQAVRVRVSKGTADPFYDNGAPSFGSSPTSSIIAYDSEGSTADQYQSVEYAVTVDYAASDEGTIPAGQCFATVDVFFYKKVSYGTNLLMKTDFLKHGSSYAILVDPESIPEDATDAEWGALAIQSINITIPSTAKIEYVLYVPQMDYSALSLFSEQIGDGTTSYAYSLPHYDPESNTTRQRFQSRATFIVKMQ